MLLYIARNNILIPRLMLPQWLGEMNLMGALFLKVVNTVQAYMRMVMDMGYINNPTSPETMVPAWIMALIKNLYNTGEDILDALDNYVNGVWE